MKRKNENLLNNCFRLLLMLFATVIIFSGCASDDDDNNPSKIGPAPESPVAELSSLTVNPSTIPADGQSEATVVVILADTDSKLFADDTEVQLIATNGTIISENPARIKDGRAEFTVQAPTVPCKGVLSLPDYPDVEEAEILFSSNSSGTPASIRIESVNPAEIAVTGVGETDNTAVHLRVLDDTGVEIAGSDYAIYARMLTRPHGGERFGQGDSDDEILLSITEGTSSFNVQSGTLPGAIEIEAEVLDKNTNESLTPAVKTIIQRISIASGPPHTVFMSTSIPPKVIDLLKPEDSGLPQTPGFYCQYAGLSVNDRWGNPVPDGTIINLGVMDSVLASGTADISGDILQITIKDSMPNPIRDIEHGDRVIIKDASLENKSRFVEEVGSDEDGSLWIKVTKPYAGEGTDLEYIVGASLLGSSIHGINEDGPAKGTVITKEGLGQLRFVYPSGVAGQYENDPYTRIISIITTSEYDDDFYGYSPENSRFVLILLDEGTLGFFPLPGSETATGEQEPGTCTDQDCVTE